MAQVESESESESEGQPPLTRMLVAKDRFNKSMADKYTTERVRLATAAYLGACASATTAVRRALQDLSGEVLKDMVTIMQASHWAVSIPVHHSPLTVSH